MPARRSGWRMRAATLLLAALAGVTAAQAEGRSRNAVPYVEARETFRRLGYQPYFMPGADICDPDDPRCYPELAYCAKSRTFACTYTWKRGRSIIEVETRYDNPVVAYSSCIVNCSPAAREHRGGSDASTRRSASSGAD